MQSKRLIIGYLFFICVLLFTFIVYGWQQFMYSIGSIIIYSIIAFLLHKLWKKLRSGQAMTYKVFFSLFLYKGAFYCSLIILILGGFIWYQNFLSPAKMPQFTLSNGKQTIVFQGMSHIASEEFYNEVAKDINRYKRQNYVLYYEGVTPGTEENNRAFNEALGIQFDAHIYENFSKLYGVEAQDNNMFLGIVNNLDYNIDLSLNKVMDLYRNKTKGEQKESIIQSDEVYEINNELIDRLANLGEKELIVLRYINQSILNFIIKHEGLRNTIIQKLGNEDIFSVILDDRNAHLVHEIQNRKEEKIFIIYGLMHFNGILELLQKKDANWEITSIKYSDVIHQDS